MANKRFLNGDKLLATEIVSMGGINLQNLFNYSAEETPIGTWFGKTLYRKVVIINEGIASTTTNVFPHGISNADMVMARNVYFYNINTAVCYPLPIVLYAGNTTEDNVNIQCDRTNITFYVATKWGPHWQKIVVLEYTKND